MTIRLIVAALLLTQASCLFFHGQRYRDFTALTPLSAERYLILGFLGGRESWDDSTQGVRQLALKLRGMDIDAAVETVENKKRKLALQLISNAYDGNRDGRLDEREKRRVRLILYGQSFGGAAVVKLARQLQAWQIPVLLTVQIDSVGRGDGVIPSNVAAAANLFQDNGWLIKGESEIQAEDPDHTRILGNFRFDYSKKKVDLSGVHWFKRLFRVAHTKMGQDPEVWGLVERLILEAVEEGATPEDRPVETGADRLFEAEYLAWIADKRVGLITNQTGVNRDLVATAQLLERHPKIQLAALFAPEHGLEGDLQAGDEVASSAKVHSLYGETRAPTPEMLRDLDVLVYDIQDVGARFYTFISTLYESMKAACNAGVSFVVLDRPVPIDGSRLEGPVLEEGFQSFVGIHRLPIRYAMTPGELARLLAAENKLGCAPKIVPLRNWVRSSWFDETGLVWVPPSPNMPTLETAGVYPGLCLIEGTNLSEGRGTTRPFELVGAPWLNHGRLTAVLNGLELPGVRFRPQNFTPTFSKHQGQVCRGVQIHVLDRSQFQPVETAVHFLAQVRELHPDRFAIRESFDRLAGSSWLREGLLMGEAAETLIQRWREGLRDFEAIRQKHLIYR